MNHHHSQICSRFRWLRQSCALVCFVLACCVIPGHAQDFDKPLQNIDEDITAFGYSPDGRIVYSVRRIFKTKKYQVQRDDIWLEESHGKRRRLLNGEKFTQGDATFTYSVDSFRWSPDKHLILAQLFTSTVNNDNDRPRDEFMTLVLDDSGREVKVNGGSDSIIKDCSDAVWLQDNSTIVYFDEILKPRILFSFQYATTASSPGGKLFEGRTFLGFDVLPHTNTAIAVERDRNMSGPPRMQRLDLLAQEDKELATLDDFSGGLSISPSGKKVAYFLDKEVLEIRDLTSPNRVARARIGFGVFHWSPDESSILLKRGPERKTADLVWIDLPQPAVPPRGKEIPIAQPTPTPIFHDLAYRAFAISPDGRFLAVTPPGKHNLMIFPLVVH